MKIQGLPFGANRAQNTEGVQKSETAGDAKRTGKTAKSERQGSIVEKDRRVAAGYVVAPEYEPRVELLESVAQRISAGEYQRPEIQEAVAQRLVDTSVEVQESRDAAAETDLPSSKRLESIGENITAVYYDNTEVLQEIAQRLAPVLGLSALFEPAAE